ncbi:MAG: prephenate dehydratase domain-containing protein [Candidatus Gracilibacteria bacterium]|nr:prephenate dehydratase domain-containing protein [Candidatus Gracilibacteria bacterium]
MSDNLKIERDQIDKVDQHVLELLAERQTHVKKIGEIKQEEGLNVYDPKRELNARTKRKHSAKSLGLDPLRTEVIFEQIVLLARDTQSREEGSNSSLFKGLGVQGRDLRVGVMGGIGSFSEAAALQHLGSQEIHNYELQYPISSENVLKDLNAGKIDLGIFPIENSTAGMVTESIRAASQYTFDIIDIFDFDVEHCLIVLPGVKKKNITKVMSHPQALKQCKGYLKQDLPNAELIEGTDTAEGARILEQTPEETGLAVIASKRCAELYHLEVLEEGIQDLEVNYTRFIAATNGDLNAISK